MRVLLFILLFGYSSLFAYVPSGWTLIYSAGTTVALTAFSPTRYITLNSDYAHSGTSYGMFMNGDAGGVSVSNTLTNTVLQYGNSFSVGAFTYYTVNTSGCPAGTEPNVNTGVCEAPSCVPMSSPYELTHISQSSCQGTQIDITNYTKYSELLWQDCDSTCYGIPIGLVTCEEAAKQHQLTCNSALNTPVFECHEDGVNPITVTADCIPKVDPCIQIENDMFNTCQLPNVITGTCESNNFIVTSNTLKCTAPPSDVRPCEVFKNNLMLTCQNPSYITGTCSDDTVNIISNSYSCYTPPIDSNTSSLTANDLSNQTSAITNSLDTQTNSLTGRLDDIANNTSDTALSVQTTNNKLDDLMRNNRIDSSDIQRHVDDLKYKVSSDINDLKNSNVDKFDELIKTIKDKNTSIPDLNISVDNPNPLPDTVNGFNSGEYSVGALKNSLLGLDNLSNDFTTFKDNIVSDISTVNTSFSNAEALFDGSLALNPIETVSTCPQTLEVMGRIYSLDLCERVSPYSNAIYTFFYMLGFFGILITFSYIFVLKGVD